MLNLLVVFLIGFLIGLTVGLFVVNIETPFISGIIGKLKKLLSIFLLLLFPSYVGATDWCGKTLPGGTSISSVVSTVLDAHQNCNNSTGIKIPSYARLVGNGYKVTGSIASGRACIRAIGAKYVGVENVEVSQCGADGVDFSNVIRPNIIQINAHNNKTNGIRCNNCTKVFLKNNVANSNGSSGIFIQNSNVVNGSDNITLYNNLDGIRILSSYSIKFYNGWEQYNGYKDVEFTNETFDSLVVRGHNGNCYFSNGAFNNICSNYATCKSDGSGHGSNQCQ